jgi:transcriptional regulator with XRE-family HTH domain
MTTGIITDPAALAFTVSDRMRKSADVAGVSVGEIAEYFDVNRNTVGRWLNGRTQPDRRTVRLWAMRCGVPTQWLLTGVFPPEDERARQDSNLRPWDYRTEAFAPVFLLTRRPQPLSRFVPANRELVA